jgi:hypothetical protein
MNARAEIHHDMEGEDDDLQLDSLRGDIRDAMLNRIAWRDDSQVADVRYWLHGDLKATGILSTIRLTDEFPKLSPWRAEE